MFRSVSAGLELFFSPILRLFQYRIVASCPHFVVERYQLDRLARPFAFYDDLRHRSCLSEMPFLEKVNGRIPPHEDNKCHPPQPRAVPPHMLTGE